MAWLLKSDRSRLQLKDRLTLGRADFPADIMLSRRHVEFAPQEAHVYVTDLGSTNGTFIGDRRLTPNVSYRISPGDFVKIGDTRLQLQLASEVKIPYLLPITVGCTSMLEVAAVMMRPSMDWGRALGVLGFLVVMGWTLSSTLIAAVVCDLAMKKWPLPTFRNTGYFAIVFLASVLLGYGLLVAADNDWQVDNFLIQQKIEHFCLERFNPAECVATVNQCPECAKGIIRWKRNMMVENLKLFQNPPANLPTQSSSRAGTDREVAGHPNVEAPASARLTHERE